MCLRTRLWRVAGVGVTIWNQNGPGQPVPSVRPRVLHEVDLRRVRARHELLREVDRARVRGHAVEEKVRARPDVTYPQ